MTVTASLLVYPLAFASNGEQNPLIERTPSLNEVKLLNLKFNFQSNFFHFFNFRHLANCKLGNGCNSKFEPATNAASHSPFMIDL